MARIGHMDPNLMGAASLQFTFHRRGSAVGQFLYHPHAGHSMFTILQHNRLALPVRLMASQLGCDFKLIARLK